ncbi:DnaD domain protein [Proteiniclasticum sp. SCR006]|uniref:DnaD domain protein n=1 Tax=Proteiniclasticum aestuarii TaxID=2817862 RepID=A0A939H9B5_9CLOT|nr:DnaD domain protein [Proteiniclasticum aestuarii]MBO1264348.1 DnaD domain protein [Proteiniclasticum aestuarii]
MHRKLLDSAVFQNADLLKVWIWCLLKATHKDFEMMVGLQVVDLQPGQFITGRTKGSEELKLKPSTFRDYLKTLEKMGMIELKPDNKKTLVTIANWEKYQTEEGRNRQQPDNRPTTSRQRPDTNNNNNNNNNINKYIYGYLEQSWSMLINPSMVDDIDHLIKEYGEEKVKAGIDICTEKNVRTSRYLTAVVRNGSKRKEDQGGKSSGFDEEAAKLRNEGIGF